MTITSTIKSGLEQQQTRQQLLSALQAEKQDIVSAIEKCYQQGTHNVTASVSTLQAMIASFDRVIAQEDWDSSLFLRNTVKSLKNMRTQAQELLDQLQGCHTNEDIVIPTLAAGMVPVYIAIFKNKARRLSDWEQQLRSLSQYLLGRPVYREESAAKKAVRAKLVQTSDAYVCVGVPEMAIQANDYQAAQTDKHGSTLIQLSPGSVRSENILEFVYQDKHYYFIDGKLIEKSE